MSPQLRVHRLRTFSTITKELVIVAIANEATLFVGDQTVLAFGYKPLAHTFKICWVKVAIYCVVIMQFCMSRRQLRLLGVHFSTLVTAH